MAILDEQVWQRVKEVFDLAVERPAAERAALLAEACRGDALLRSRVESLLAAHEEEEAAAARSPTVGADRLAGDAAGATLEAPGARVGPYKLLEPIGEGGFGLVFMAEQEQPIRRRVALKIIKAGMDSKEVLARFEAERQALALMNHPNIARVLEAGATETGRPYFVMELVRGSPITQYCDDHELSPPERLELFMAVCQAVQHAHQKGIIHRDLKPSNVLVTVADDRPIPKVIDFGVAKALHQKLTDKTLFTGLRQMIGTPAYMSPEQADLGAVDIDTRSDIYALGVLLYELLTGTTPFDPQTLRNATFDEMRRIIREVVPEKPSTRVASGLRTGRPQSEPRPSGSGFPGAALGDGPLPHGRGSDDDRAPEDASSVVEIARHRHTDPAALRRLLHGDLDWIVMKCLEKDRARRYETASAVAVDVQHYLTNQPILARAPGAIYQLEKLIARHKALFASLAALFAVLVLAVIGLSLATAIIAKKQAEIVVQRDEAQAQKQRAEANLRLALDALDEIYLKVAERLPAKQTEISAADRALLDNALTFYERFASENSNSAWVRHETGRAYGRAAEIHSRLGRFEQAVEAYRQALKVFEALSNLFHVVSTRCDIAETLSTAGRAAEALEECQQSVALGRKLVAESPNDADARAALARALGGQGLAFVLLAGRFDEGEQALRESLTLREQLAVEFPDNRDHQLDLAKSQHDLGLLMAQVERYADAEPLLRQALAHQERWSFDSWDRHKLAMSHNNLGYVLWRSGKLTEAEQAYSAGIRIREQLVAEFPHTADFRNFLGGMLSNLGIVLQELGRAAEAEQAYRRALEIHEGLVAEFPDVAPYQGKLAAAAGNLAQMLEGRAQFADAAALYERAIHHGQQALNVNAQDPTYRADLSHSYDQLAGLLVTCPDPALRDPPRAVQLAKSALELAPDDTNMWNTLGTAHYRAGDWPAAIAAHEKSLELKPGVGSCSYFFLSMAHWQLGDRAQAREWYDRAVAWMQAEQPDDQALQRFRAEADELMGFVPATAPQSESETRAAGEPQSP